MTISLLNPSGVAQLLRHSYKVMFHALAWGPLIAQTDAPKGVRHAATNVVHPKYAGALATNTPSSCSTTAHRISLRAPGARHWASSRLLPNPSLQRTRQKQRAAELSERLNYDRLYQEALSDLELKRTAVELEAALSNAREAREVVFDLFQDLEDFSLADYKPFSDITTGMDRPIHFLSAAVADRQTNRQGASSRKKTLRSQLTLGNLPRLFFDDASYLASGDCRELSVDWIGYRELEDVWRDRRLVGRSSFCSRVRALRGVHL